MKAFRKSYNYKYLKFNYEYLSCSVRAKGGLAFTRPALEVGGWPNQISRLILESR